MNDKELSELLHTQKSLTEWLEEIGHRDTNQLRAEDNNKRERLKVLNRVIKLPFDKPVQFAASELSSDNKTFIAYLKNHGDELCAIRLIPLDSSLPKLRMRGKTVSEAYRWFTRQKIDTDKYRVDFMPHIEASDSSWSTIFVVNRHGIQGEMIFGGHHQLTQGFHDNSRPITFSFDFKDWAVSPSSEEALSYVKNLVRYIFVDNTQSKKMLVEQLEATFCNNYLEGYFETTDSSRGVWFIDYNQSLGRMYSDVKFPVEAIKATEENSITGRVGSSGVASGITRIINPDDINNSTFREGDVLVCNVTTPMFIPLMKKAAAIVTDQGGILSHAAIVARELGIPCVVGTQTATSLLKNGQLITVDADIGRVWVDEKRDILNNNKSA